MSKPLISLCLIVKNEEMLLPRALQNLQGFWDELIVVDTGSADNTVAVARANGAKVLHFDWGNPGNKGAARNMGLDAASGKWIVVLDADEIIEQPGELRTWLKDSRPHGVHVQFANVDPGGNVNLVWNQLRIFRRGLYRYHYREHEIPKPIAEGLNEAVVGFTFIHRPPAERQPAKTGPMLNRLLLDVEENPGDPHPAYFLHRQYLHAEQWDKAIEAGKRYLSIAGDGDKCECYGNLAAAHEKKGEIVPALRYLHLALAEQPHRRYWWVRIAELHVAGGRWNFALGYLRAALEMWRQPEQHYQPATDARIHQLAEQCQQALAHAVQSHEHQHAH